MCSECICCYCLKRWNGKCSCKCKAQECAHGIFHPTESCDKFIQFEGVKLEECMMGVKTIYQDGAVSCMMGSNYGCQKCIAEIYGEEKLKKVRNGE